MAESDGSYDPPPFDVELANTYVGMSILLGITYLDFMGNKLRHEQLHGMIDSVSPKGLEISLRGAREGESFSLPPDLRWLNPANPGEYKLRATGEVVLDPDLIGTCTITKPPAGEA